MVSPRCFVLLFFSLLLPPRHQVKAGQYKEFVFSLSPSFIIIDSNTILKFITAFRCTWMENSTYLGWQIKFAVEKLQHFCSAFGWKMLLVTPEVYGQKAKNASKTLQQNQTGLILLQCFCSIFLLEKLNFAGKIEFAALFNEEATYSILYPWSAQHSTFLLRVDGKCCSWPLSLRTDDALKIFSEWFEC